MLSMLKKGRAPKASYTEWVVDDLSDPVLTAVEEGSDVTSFANPGVNRARIGNHVQRQDRSWSVSDLEELVEDAAVANQVATAKSKKLIELRRDMASVIGSDQANQAGGGGSGAAGGGARLPGAAAGAFGGGRGVSSEVIVRTGNPDDDDPREARRRRKRALERAQQNRGQGTAIVRA